MFLCFEIVLDFVRRTKDKIVMGLCKQGAKLHPGKDGQLTTIRWKIILLILGKILGFRYI